MSIRGRSQRGLLLLALGLLPAILGASPDGGDQAVRSAPTRPSEPPWPTVRIRGEDHVDLKVLASRLGWKAEAGGDAKSMALADGSGRRADFVADRPDFRWDGARIFLGNRVVAQSGSMWVHQLDLVKTLLPVLSPRTYSAQLGVRPRVVVLDPGHGGSDPGKQNLKLRLDEKVFTLDVAKRVKQALELRGFTVLLTRDQDVRLAENQVTDLQRRADFANRSKADLFVSIHFNALDPAMANRVSGSETYVITPQSQVSTQAEQDESMVPVRYPGNRQDAANIILGFQLHRHLIRQLESSDRGLKRYRYAVLRFLDCPGALVEAAYLSNDAEAAKVATPEFRQRIALAIADGIEAYADVVGPQKR